MHRDRLEDLRENDVRIIVSRNKSVFSTAGSRIHFRRLFMYLLFLD